MQSTLNSNTNTTAVDFQGAASIQAAGTFNGATVTAYISLDGGTTYIIPTDSSAANLTFTAAGAQNLECAKAKLKFGMTGAATSNVQIDVVNFKDLS